MKCNRFFSVLVLVLAIASSGKAISTDALPGMPDRNTPRELAEVWLRFHELNLCQGVAAEFGFSERGMEIRGLIEDDRSYEKLLEILQPIRGSYKIALNLDRREEEKSPDESKDKNPPASLWENYELRSFLGDPFARARERIGFDEDSHIYFPPPDDMLKQRLLIYADQILEWNDKIERYAKHLPAITRVAADPGMAAGLRVRAHAVDSVHAQEMERLLGKLNTNLEAAFPHSDKRDQKGQLEKEVITGKTIIERADHLCDFAQTVSMRVRRFIHPEEFTVGLDELRQPSLLESMKNLQKMNLEFKKALAKTK
jgi:hypothetical protein